MIVPKFILHNLCNLAINVIVC